MYIYMAIQSAYRNRLMIAIGHQQIREVCMDLLDEDEVVLILIQ